MGRSRRRPRRRRVGRVSVYPHHGSWWIYYIEAGAQVRKKVAADEETAAIVAAEVNAQLASKAPSLVAFRPTSVAELQRAYLAHHEYVLRSSLATVNRYPTATRHLVAFSEGRHETAHELRTADFAKYLRTIRVRSAPAPLAARSTPPALRPDLWSINSRGGSGASRPTPTRRSVCWRAN